MNNPKHHLARYIEQGSREAFEELVKEHVNLVYGAALRQVGDVHLAEDVTQAVFLVLSKMARSIRKTEALAGWLMTVTRNASVDAMRKKIRREHHERAAARPQAIEQAADAWEKTSPLLDEALTQLPSKDRDSVTLRFFQNWSFSQIGQALGISEDASRKRVDRALEKLKQWLTARGVVLPAAVLATMIGANATQAAPPGVAAACLGKASASVALLAKGAIKMMAWKKIRSAAIAAAMLALIGGVWINLAMAGQPAAPEGLPQPPVLAAPAATRPAATTPRLRDPVRGVNAITPFAVSLMNQTGQEKTNAVYSPLSIMEAFGLQLMGARGETESELGKALAISKNAMPDAIGKLNELFTTKADQPYELKMANAMWINNGFPLLAEFEKTAKETFQSAGFNCDFKANSERERTRINDWVASNTNDKIKDLCPPGSITDKTRLVLTNAIYFKANWEHPFTPSNTTEEPFTLATGEKVKVKMMSRNLQCPYFRDGRVAMAAIPYKGGNLSFVVMIPQVDTKTVATMEREMTAQWLGRCLEALMQNRNRINLSMPKFRVEAQYDLIKTMKSLGVNKIFSDTEADLSGITNDSKGLYVQAAFHKAFIDVDENGAQAAAATMVESTAGGKDDYTPPAFKVDQPFMFVIMDNQTRAPLFIGRVMDPTAK